jgi:signal-transduction protein with cAMP-binding, CBS, and nucleotidyltransferase domain
MLVEVLLPAAREHLATIPESAPLIEAARLLRAGTDLIAVCDASGAVVGVVTKTDVVGQISHCQGASCTCAIASVMTRDILICHADDQLSDLWLRMKARRLKSVPLVDQQRQPLGVITAKDALQFLLQISKNEEDLLRDYVLGLGYR